MRMAHERPQRRDAALWRLVRRQHGVITRRQLLSGGLSGDTVQRRPGIRVHRRAGPAVDRRRVVDGIPVTDPVVTLIDIAERKPLTAVERAVREADRLDLVDPEKLRSTLDDIPRQPGLGWLRALLDSQTFALTDSELERRFLRLVREAGLPKPETQALVNGLRVDFYWRDLGLVVEADGLRYHRTPDQQKKDHLRDQRHAATGLTTLGFAATQIRDEADRTTSTLRAVLMRLQADAR